MNRLLHTALNIVWGVWFGGLIMLLIAVQSLFHTPELNRALAGDAALGLFKQFNTLRLGLAGAALLLAAANWIRRKSGMNMTAFVVFVLASLAAFYSTAVLAPRIASLHADGLTQSAEFTRLHGLSMAVYAIETLMVFFAGLLLPNIRNTSAFDSVADRALNNE